MKRTHRIRNGKPTAAFGELSFAEQAKSISATVNVLGRMINSNLRRAREESRDTAEILEKRLEQVERMVNRRKTR